MSDELLERKRRDGTLTLADRLRCGEITRERVEIAAYCGHAGAIAAHPEWRSAHDVLSAGVGGDFADWLSGLERWDSPEASGQWHGLDVGVLHCLCFVGSRAAGAAIQQLPPQLSPDQAHKAASYGHYWLERYGKLAAEIKDTDQRIWAFTVAAWSVFEARTQIKHETKGIRSRWTVHLLDLTRRFLDEPNEDNRVALLESNPELPEFPSTPHDYASPFYDAYAHAQAEQQAEEAGLFADEYEAQFPDPTLMIDNTAEHAPNPTLLNPTQEQLQQEWYAPQGMESARRIQQGLIRAAYEEWDQALNYLRPIASRSGVGTRARTMLERRLTEYECFEYGHGVGHACADCPRSE